MLVSISACQVQTETTGTDSQQPLADDSNASADMSGDALIAPDAPELLIRSSTGYLHFSWTDNHNESASEISEINLYRYNTRSNQETRMDVSIDTVDLHHTIAIKPHQVDWNNTRFRVEICNNSDCLSSYHVAIDDLLINAPATLQSQNPAYANSFGDDVALSSNGSLLAVASPLTGTVSIYMADEQKWTLLTALSSTLFTRQSGAKLKVAMSSNGDTIAIASAARAATPSIVVFDRIGNGWVETAIVQPEPNNISGLTWDTNSLQLQLAANGERMVFAVQAGNSSVNATTIQSRNNRIHVYDRQGTGWLGSARLSVEAQHQRLRSISGSPELEVVHAVSHQNGSLYLHTFGLTASGWLGQTPQQMQQVVPTYDTTVTSVNKGLNLVLSAWTYANNGTRAATALLMEQSGGVWSSTQGVIQAPIADPSAELRVATDGTGNALALGWQGSNQSSVIFYSSNEAIWQSLFELPGAFRLNRNLPYVQSIAISQDNSTAAIGTTSTGSGGMLTTLR